jgi:hypothetical protein
MNVGLRGCRLVALSAKSSTTVPLSRIFGTLPSGWSRGRDSRVAFPGACFDFPGSASADASYATRLSRSSWRSCLGDVAFCVSGRGFGGSHRRRAVSGPDDGDLVAVELGQVVSCHQ